MASVDWNNLDLETLSLELRATRGGPDAERMIWAFEESLRIARIDGELLSYLLVACVCLLARADDVSPRDVLEAFFRRSITDDEWRRAYRPLFG